MKLGVQKDNLSKLLTSNRKIVVWYLQQKIIGNFQVLSLEIYQVLLLYWYKKEVGNDEGFFFLQPIVQHSFFPPFWWKKKNFCPKTIGQKNQKKPANKWSPSKNCGKNSTQFNTCNFHPESSFTNDSIGFLNTKVCTVRIVRRNMRKEVTTDLFWGLLNEIEKDI